MGLGGLAPAYLHLNDPGRAARAQFWPGSATEANRRRVVYHHDRAGSRPAASDDQPGDGDDDCDIGKREQQQGQGEAADRRGRHDDGGKR